MLKIIIVIPMLLALDSMAQIPCNRLPDSTRLLAQLAKRPVLNLSPKIFLDKCNISNSVKRRIIELLDWQWTAEELERYLHQDIDTARITRLANGDKRKKDSILSIYINEKRKNLAKYNFKIDGGLTLVPAKLYMKESIPILEKALLDSFHYRPNFVRLSLARLGFKEHQRTIIDQCSNDKQLIGHQWVQDANAKMTKLIFICTQESVYKFVDFMDTSKVYQLSVDGGLDQKSATDGVWFLSRIILNADFKGKYDWERLYNSLEINNEVILYCKDWLIKNKGNYQLNKEYVFY